MSVDWEGLFAALAFVLVIEGLFPLVNPRGARSAFETLSRLPESDLRVAGVVSVVVGTGLLFFIKA